MNDGYDNAFKWEWQERIEKLEARNARLVAALEAALYATTLCANASDALDSLMRDITAILADQQSTEKP